MLVCYQSETLHDFPNIDGCDLKQYMIENCPRTSSMYRKETDAFYEQILIVEFKDGAFTNPKWIPTGTMKGQV